MHSKSTTRILAIDPGTREMGVALLDRRELVYHGVRTIRKRQSPRDTLDCGRNVVLRLISDFRPQVLAFEKTFFASNRNAALLNVFADEIKAIGQRKGLRVQAFAPSTIKKHVCGHGHATKQEVAHAVVARYPDLKVYLTQDRKWKARYHANMFAAVAIALTATDAGGGR